MRSFGYTAAIWRDAYRAVICAICLCISCAAGQSLEELPILSPLDSDVADLPLDPAAKTQLQQAIGSRDYATAESSLLRAMNKSPSEPRLLSYAGRVFFVDHKYLNAAIAMKKADSQHRLSNPDRFILAMSFIALQKPDWSRGELDQLVQSDPANPLYIYWQGRLDYDDQKFVDAAIKFRRVITLDATFMRAYDNLGLCLEAMGKSEEAEREYGRALTLDRQRKINSPWPPLNLGALLVQLNRQDEAEPLFREALQFDPSFALAHYQLGALLERQGKSTQAIEELNHAGELDPANPQPHYALARIYRRIGDMRQAKQEIETFRKLSAKSQTK